MTRIGRVEHIAAAAKKLKLIRLPLFARPVIHIQVWIKNILNGDEYLRHTVFQVIGRD